MPEPILCPLVDATLETGHKQICHDKLRLYNSFISPGWRWASPQLLLELGTIVPGSMKHQTSSARRRLPLFFDPVRRKVTKLGALKFQPASRGSLAPESDDCFEKYSFNKMSWSQAVDYSNYA